MGGLVRLLSLHGRFQNGYILAKKLSGLGLQDGASVQMDGFQVKMVLGDQGQQEHSRTPSVEVTRDSDGKQVVFETLDAPHVVEAKVNMGKNASLRRKERDISKLGPACQTRAWWYALDGNHLRGAEESMDLVEGLVKDRQIDGIFGFSQGAALAYRLNVNLDYLICCSGYAFEEELPSSSTTTTTRHDKVKKSLHVFSDLDRMVRPERSQVLAELMSGQVQKHDQGHSIPLPWFYSTLFHFVFK